MEKYFKINDIVFMLYFALSGDYIVAVSEPGKAIEYHNMGERENAIDFILSYAEIRRD